MRPAGSEPTRLLRRLSAGDPAAGDALLPLIYDELRAAAERAMHAERREHTLQPTALVHEAWLKLADAGGDWSDRKHFIGVAARAMRQVLVDHARAKKTGKRGGDRQRVQLDGVVDVLAERSVDLVDLDEALVHLGQKDAELTRLVELRFFGGLTVEETAEVLGVSQRRIERGWEVARSWLHGKLSRKDDDG